MVLKKVGLTGASGMVGRHTLDLLTAKNIACVTTSSNRSVPVNDNLSWFAWDLRENRDIEELDQLFDGVNALLHVGAIVPNPQEIIKDRDMFDANVKSCLLLGQWATKRSIPVVFLSGALVYANQNRKGIKENYKKAYNGFGGFYGLTKLLAEAVFLHMQEKGLKVAILRPSSIYGYGLHHTKMITNFLLRAAQGEVLEVYPPADDKIDLIHASDVAKAMTDTLEKDVTGIFNIAGGVSYTMGEIAQTCVDVVGKGSVRVIQKKAERKPLSRFALNCDAARKSFTFTAETNLNSGLKSMWLKMQLHGMS